MLHNAVYMLVIRHVIIFIFFFKAGFIAIL